MASPMFCSIFSLAVLVFASGIVVAEDSASGDYENNIKTMLTILRNRQEIIQSQGKFNPKPLRELSSLLGTGRLLQLAEEVSLLMAEQNELMDELSDTPSDARRNDTTAMPERKTNSSGQEVGSLLMKIVMKILQGQVAKQGNAGLLAGLMSQLNGGDTGAISGIMKIAQPLLQNTGLNDQLFGPALTGILTTLAQNPSIFEFGSAQDFNKSTCKDNSTTKMDVNGTMPTNCSSNNPDTKPPFIVSVIQGAAALAQAYQILPSQCRADMSTMFNGLVGREGWALSSML